LRIICQFEVGIDSLVVCLLNRFFSYDLELDVSHKLVCLCYPVGRICAAVYQDGPCYLSILSVDDKPILKESMIENLKKYVSEDLTYAPFLEFLFAYDTPGES